MFSGCKKDPSDDEIRNALIGKWTLVTSSSSECNNQSWREYKADLSYDEYDACSAILRENVGTWRIEDGMLAIKARVFPIDVWYSFMYLSKSQMIIKQGLTSSSNSQIRYVKYTTPSQ